MHKTETAVVIAGSVLFTLVLLIPVAYMAHRALPPAVATVDLQKLVEEEQQRSAQAITATGGALPEAQRKAAEQAAIGFSSKLSAAVEALSVDCKCVLMNKAAVLGGGSVDLTDMVRTRMGSAR